MGILKSLLPESIYVSYIKLFNRFKNEEIHIDDEITQEKRKQFYSQFLNANDTVFDVGANYGNRVIPFLNLGCKVIAIEPQEKCNKYLENKFGNQIQIIKKGLSTKEEIKEFYISNSSTISTFSKDWLDKVKDGRFKHYEWNKVEKIEMTTLDKVIAEFGKPRFIKIDVEGYELEVIKGLSTSIPYISIEYNVPENTDKSIGCIEHLYNIENNCKFNYSVGESMQLELKDWLLKDEFITLINTDSFVKTSFGDIYIKMNNE